MSSVDLDPRFDPRFQRGYDAGRHGPLPPSATPEVAAAPAVVAASPKVAAPLEIPPRPIVEELPADEDDSDGFADEPVRRRNPYFGALVALPVVLLVAGASLLAAYAGELSQRIGSSVWDDYTIVTVAPLIAPALIVTGFAALVVLLAQLALGRGRRA